MLPDDVNVPIGQGNDPLTIVLRQSENEDLTDLLDLTTYPDDFLAVEVDVFFSGAKQFAFAHSQ
jgi:hypothetical protein